VAVPGLIMTWDDITSSAFDELYINRVNRGGIAKNRSVNVDVPGRPGSWHFTEQRSDRSIDVTFTLAADSPSTRRAELSDIFDWLDVIGRKRLIFSDQPDRYWDAFIDGIDSVDEATTLGRWTAQFIAEPYALAIATTSVCATGQSVPATSGSFNMPGAVRVDPEVTIRPRGGNLTAINFTLNGDTITWAGNISQDGTLTISSISSTVLLAASGDTMLTGAFDTSDLDMTSVSGTFGSLVPGSNAWSYNGVTGTATSLDICFSYRRRYH
jgi:predicted phage tail component-like protein